MRRCVALTLLLVVLLPGRARAGKAITGVVNLNTAPAEMLSLLPGVGPAKAAAILTYRKRRPFRTVDELVRIKGIGRKMVRRLRPHLAIAGPTTASASAPGPAAPAPGPAAKPPAPPHPPSSLHCPPPRPVGRTGRSPTHDRRPARPFPAPCLGAA
ncbi:MAG TPA: helix-hairpin-helix domain-containing protein [Polyangia bacterium]